MTSITAESVLRIFLRRRNSGGHLARFAARTECHRAINAIRAARLAEASMSDDEAVAAPHAWS
jgi:hypothetical protein